MAVAKTYEKMELCGEPFKENGRMYIFVVAPKGNKKVRWYTDAEYRRMYPNEVKHDASAFNARSAFGFGTNGYITLFKGKEEDICSWARASWPPKAWYNTLFQFYTPGYMPLENLPTSITPVRLTWDEIKLNDTTMKSDEEVKKYVNSLFYGNGTGPSQYQGVENEWLQKAITVREKTSKESRYGTKHTYTLVDSEGNTFIWETGAKDFACGAAVSLKMKVKEHKEVNGEKCTVVWYCKEV